MMTMNDDRAIPESRQRDSQTPVQELSAALDAAAPGVGVDVEDDTLSLVGAVDSMDNRDAALDLARPVAERVGLRLQDSIEVASIAPQSAFDQDEGGTVLDADPGRDVESEAGPDAAMLEPDLTEELGTTDSEEAAAEAVPYFPPTDPVVEPSDDEEQLSVVGGFAGTSMDDDLEGAPPLAAPDDEAVAHTVRRELREDALTTDHDIDVVVSNGVALLRGTVPTVEDAENVEAVVSRTRGVVETNDQLRIAALEEDAPTA